MAVKIKVLELSENKTRILFEGEGNTYMNVLTDELLKDPAVDVAQYKQQFKFSDPELVVTTKGDRAPLDAVVDAAKRLSGYATGLLHELETVATE
ncbi:DNA-directed RNA polymerase subunit L [Methanoculleus sp. FWC-SCC1]|uniref:DNA-directed RNA polymerase subunit Rpo11 n=1 Tax=Methanoculleus frigidifontis TaxID=2584085 RepID=A0ABT8MAL6_9EURY|nr:DNA-directed RNA polymerase subunit L [Methanoculleus sp. FWC-SCC1]MDN7024950.1 DNA-directed RNA polymerase subunit L [Methanoculleus sp. FWC-SCC1]